MNRSIGLALATGLLVVGAAACGSTAPSPTSVAATAPTTATAPATATAAATASDGPAAAVPDPALEARLPGTLNGVTLAKLSYTGPSIVANPNASGSPELLAVLADVHKTPADLSEAFASDSAWNLKVSLGAIRVAGADGGATLTAFVSENQKRVPTMTSSQATVGGKAVTVISNPSEPVIGLTYAYSKGDTVFFVTSADAALAAVALEVMP